MTSAILATLPLAVGVLVTSAPLLALVLLLVTTRPAGVSAAFLCGWFLGLTAVATVVVVVGDVSAPHGLPGGVVSALRITFGAALWVLAVRSWLRRAEESDEVPRWMDGVSRWRPGRAWVTGLALGSVNPKSLVLAGSAGVAVLAATTVPMEQAVAVVAFSVVASLGVAAPVVLRALPSPRVQAALERSGRWMTEQSKTVSRVVLAVLGTVLVVTGLTG